MKLFELIISDESVDEVFAISMVDNPAIEAYGTYFDREGVRFKEMKEEGLFMAPILIPDKKIIRVDGAGQPYNVFFSADTIKRLSQMYLEKKYQDKVTLEHEMEVKGITLVESWIKESVEKDKSKMYGLNVPAGSWIGTFKIDNPEMREKFKSGEVSAVSIEGIFEHMERQPTTKLSKDYLMKDVNDLTEEEASVLLSHIKQLLQEPTISDSSYPGEVSGSYTSPETLVEEGELDVYGYETTHFYICPGAIGTFQSILQNNLDDDVRDMVRAAAVIADVVFMIEKKVVENESASDLDVRRATKLVEMFYDVMETVKERLNVDLDVSYMNGHIEVIKKYL